MKCRIEILSAEGRWKPVRVGSAPREFPNREAARQYIRNHGLEYSGARLVPVEESL
jgi:hypothetical protein